MAKTFHGLRTGRNTGTPNSPLHNKTRPGPSRSFKPTVKAGTNTHLDTGGRGNNTRPNG